MSLNKETKLYIYVWLYSIDIFCQYVFVFILSSRRINFMVSGGIG